MRILVYGGGAVGLGVASCLIRSGNSVHILARQSTVEKLKSGGLHRSGIFGEVHVLPNNFTCSSSLDEISSDFDFVLVCVKSYDSCDVAFDIKKHLKKMSSAKLVLCQNGWGNYEIFRRELPDSEIFNARIITGFERPDHNHVNITVHADTVRMGTLGKETNDDVKELCDAVSSGGLPTALSESIGKDLWAKMLYNCSLNPLGAIFQVPYGELAKQESTRKIMNQIQAEIFEVLRQANFQTHWDSAEEYQEVFYSQQIPATAEHYSSTLQDIRAGKRSEIDALNGAVLKLARKCGILTPVNETVYRMVQFLEGQVGKGKSC